MAIAVSNGRRRSRLGLNVLSSNWMMCSPWLRCFVCLPALTTVAAAANPPPVVERLRVWPTGQSFQLLGLRPTALGASQPYTLTTGMTAHEVRRQVGTTDWTSLVDHLDRRERRMQLRRQAAHAPAEAILIETDRPGEKGRVRMISYVVEPLQYTEDGLRRQLKVAFGDGEVLQSSSDRLSLRYKALSGPVTMVVSASRIERGRPLWRVEYEWRDFTLPVIEDESEESESQPTTQPESQPPEQPKVIEAPR
jgi:hypothetical protein